MLNLIIETVNNFEEQVIGNVGESERDKHYFKEGLSIAKQAIEASEDMIKEDVSYEFVEGVLTSLIDNFDRDELVEMIDELYGFED